MARRKVNDRNTVKFNGSSKYSDPVSLASTLEEMEDTAVQRATTAVFNSPLLNTSTDPIPPYQEPQGYGDTYGNGVVPPNYTNYIEQDTYGMHLPPGTYPGQIPEAIYIPGYGWTDPSYFYNEDPPGTDPGSFEQPAELPPVSGLTVEAVRPIGFPADGLQIGNGIYTASSGTNPFFSTCVYDKSDALGLGSDVFIGIHQTSTAGSARVYAYQGTTGNVTDLGFPISSAIQDWQLLLCANSLYLKQRSNAGTTSSVYRWSFTSSWQTTSVGVSGILSKMTVSGTEYLVGKTVTTPVTGMSYINPASPNTWVSGGTTFTAEVLGKDSTLWRSDGRSATAALNPTWNNVVPAMSLATEFVNFRADIDTATGLLCVLSRFNVPARYGLTCYDPGNGAATVFGSLFTTTGSANDGEPLTAYPPRLNADGVFLIWGFQDEDFYFGGAGVYGDEYPVIWLSDGVTTTILASDVSALDPNTADNAQDPYVGASLNRLGNTVTIALNYGFDASPDLSSTVDALDI